MYVGKRSGRQSSPLSEFRIAARKSDLTTRRLGLEPRAHADSEAIGGAWRGEGVRNPGAACACPSASVTCVGILGDEKSNVTPRLRLRGDALLADTSRHSITQSLK